MGNWRKDVEDLPKHSVINDIFHGTHNFYSILTLPIE
jgi:hypothetical protein